MADNPIHILATPLGVQFTKPAHDPIDDTALNGAYDTFTDVVTAGANLVPAKDDPHLTLNDWVYAARMQNGDL